MDPDLRDRLRGCLLGLAVGDAIGTTVEFRPRGSFPAVTDMTGGGPFGLQPGQWTDDASMALWLAESLTEKNGFDCSSTHKFSRPFTMLPKAPVQPTEQMNALPAVVCTH